jgi:hypothetical protein
MEKTRSSNTGSFKRFQRVIRGLGAVSEKEIEAEERLAGA